MHAIVQREYGGPDSLSFEDVEPPVPSGDEVLIRVRASSINSWDWDISRGKPFMVRMESPTKPKYPIPGIDVSGTVEQTGPDATLFEPGDEVIGDLSVCGFGAFAEFATAPESVLAPKSSDIGFHDAATLPHAGLLALQGLRKGTDLADKRVLINGGGGGAGTLAIQMAKSQGAEVTGVDSAQKLDLMRSLGADRVVDYRTEDFTRTGQLYDLILDLQSQRGIVSYRRALRPDGVLAVVGGRTASLVQSGLVGPVVSLAGSRKAGILTHRPNVDDLVTVQQLVADGTITPVIDRTLPLESVPEGIRLLGEGHTKGKIAISM